MADISKSVAIVGVAESDELDIKPADRGKIAVMQASWLEWGEANGYI